MSSPPAYPATLFGSFRKCNTPKCTLSNFHEGLHSFELCKEKRKRTRIDENLTCSPITDSSGIASYTSLCKTGQRAVFASACLNSLGKKCVYLEGPDAALTKHLLQIGISKESLVPVNRSVKVADNIEHQFPGLKCFRGDILDLAQGADVEEYGAIWFDMCGGDFGSVGVEELVHCAEYKFYTLSCRQITCSDKLDALCVELVRASEKIVEKTMYTGCGGKSLNMVFVCSKRRVNSARRVQVGTSCSSQSDEEPIKSVGGIDLGTIVFIPMSHWRSSSFVDAYDFCTFTMNKNGEDVKGLVGSVHSRCSDSDKNYRVRFQTTKGGSILCCQRYSAEFLKANIFMPQGQGPCGAWNHS